MSLYALRLQFGPTIGECEDAITGALAADPVIAAYIKQVIAFAGTWDEARRDVLKQWPSILVVYVGGRMDARGAAGAVHVAEWHVVVAARNLRAERSGRRTEGAEVGAYEMVQDVTRVLGRADLGVDGLGALEPQQVFPVRLKGPSRPTNGAAVYTCVFTSTIDLVSPAPDDDLSTIAATYDVANPDETGGPTTWVEVSADTVSDLEVP